MFDVQLGAALLLQFEGAKGPIRVLADAGHRKYKVAGKLTAAFADFADGDRRIDLIVGTHYDADHLAGLVDVIKDPTLDIGEIWLPPVVNDVDAATRRVASADDNLLVLQLLGDKGPDVLDRYLRAKARICLDASGSRVDNEALFVKRAGPGPLDAVVSEDWEDWEARLKADPLAFFEDQLAEAETVLGWRDLSTGKPSGEGDDDHDSHADHVIVSPFDVRVEPETAPEWFHYQPNTVLKGLDRLITRRGVAALALIQQSAAKGAINAKALAEVVDAIKARAVRPRVMSCTNSDGKPRPFGWDAKSARFAPDFKADKDDPSLILLGPSDGLVERYRHLEPRGDYRELAYKLVPIVDTTESNELSYVIRFAHRDQAILVAGDAACVDFGPLNDEAKFHPALIAALGRLDVIQIAHHGGANGYFYNALLASPFRTQDRKAFLLLSHETRKTKRPSGEFSKFVEACERSPDTLSLVFTAQPLEAKVRNITRYFHKPVGNEEDSGDARLIFAEGDWKVVRHAVTVPRPS